MKKFILHILILIITLVGFFSPVYKIQAQTSASPDQSYHFLAPLPCDKGTGCVGGKLTTFDPTSTDAQNSKIGEYLNMMIRIFIGLCAVLAVIMIVIGGIEYMTTELVSSKEAGKERITQAILGLLLALGAWTLLYTINPNLLNTDLSSLTTQTVDVALTNSIYTKVDTPGNDYSARCTTIPSGPCSSANLSSTFGAQADGMSKICNVESGGNANAVSGTDKGTDGTAFSFGLLQINLLSNGSAVTGSAGESCANLFTRTDGSTIVGSNYIQKNSSGQVYYDAVLKPGMQQTYNDCKATLLDPAKNIQVAKTLFNQGNTPTYNNNAMFAWSPDKGVCASAFSS
jgi:type IV secretory pathway VirB2 component (pilin)